MDIEFKFEKNAMVAHFLNPRQPLLIIERLYYDREGGGTKQYFCRGTSAYGTLYDKLIGLNESELKLYEEDKDETTM